MMLFSDKWIVTLIVTTFVQSPVAALAHAKLACPAMLDGRPLDGFGLFEGDPANQGELMPRDGGFDVPQVPLAMWRKVDGYTLQCQYKNPRRNINIFLPFGTKTCEFDFGPKIKCR